MVWNKLPKPRRVVDLLRGLGSLLSAAMLTTPGIGEASAALQIYPLPVPTKQYQIVETTFPLPVAEGYSFSTSTATGKFQPVSFVLRASEALRGIQITVSPLLGPATIPSSNVDVRLVKTWYQASSGNCSCDVGKYLIPEILLKDDGLVRTDRLAQKSYLRATVGGEERYLDITTVDSTVPIGATVRDSAVLQPFSMAAQTNKQVWATIHVPVGTPAGNYAGSFTIAVAGKPAATLSYGLRVLPFALAPALVEQAIYYRAQLQDSCPHLTPECRTPGQMAADFANLRDHGIRYPTFYERWSAPRLGARLALMENAGLPKDRIFQLGDNLSEQGVANLAELSALVKRWNSIAASRGWGEVYNYGIDEATGAAFDSQLAAFDTIHAQGGKTINAIPNGATALRPGMNKVDVAVLYGYGARANTVALAQQSGAKVYRYGGPFSDMENPEYVRKHFGLGLLYQGYDGAMNYAYQHVGQHRGDIWNDFKANAAGERNHAWTYPTSDGVLDTLQWEGYREAVDDIRYASTLAARRGWSKSQLLSYLRSLPMLADNADVIDAEAARQAIIQDILAASAVSPAGAKKRTALKKNRRP